MPRIVQFPEYGGPEVLEVVERDVQEPGPGEIRVRTGAIGVGVPDMLMRSGNYAWIPPLPVIPGNELAGVVDAVGAGVSQPKTGTRVYVNARELSQRGGCYADEIVVPAAAAFVLPDTVSDEHAVSLGNYQLSWLLLNYAVKTEPGDRALVHAAAGGVGAALVQMAKAKGLEVIGIAGSAEKIAYVSNLGADHVIDRSGEVIVERVAELTGGAGVDVIYDSVSGPMFGEAFDMLAPMGTTVLFGYLGGKPPAEAFPPVFEKMGKSMAIRVFSIHVVDDKPDIRRHAMEQAIAAMASGDASPHVHTVMKLADAADAHRLLETGTVTGKVVLVP
ncbi:MAG: zinc-dependent alcohol dehydrogenase family protein [Alphaproteobacteria bacterium]